jgi:HKD family nuclease
MSFQLIKSPFENDFKNLLGETKREFVFSSPYINESGVNIFLNSIQDKSKVRVNVLTNLSLKNLVDDVTQPSALLKIYDGFKETTISSLATLHAKVYIVDERFAVVTSANLTYGGIKSNFEYGVLIDDLKTVSSIKKDVLEYANLGNIIDKILLQKIYDESKKIEKLKTKKEKSFEKSDLAELLKKSKQKINVELLENRVTKGKTINGIFSDTIIYLLSKYGSLTTEELNNHIQTIHPDICDDAIDRVINGQHFGKLWKHSVRNAQFSLKKKGVINNSGQRGYQTWFLT